MVNAGLAVCRRRSLIEYKPRRIRTSLHALTEQILFFPFVRLFILDVGDRFVVQILEHFL
jgi:hypothetical protein